MFYNVEKIKSFRPVKKPCWSPLEHAQLVFLNTESGVYLQASNF